MLGLDISRTHVRYVVTQKKRGQTRLLSYGAEEIPQREPHNALLSVLQSIRRKTKIRDCVISLPEGSTHSALVHIPRDVPEERVLSELTHALIHEGLFHDDDTVLAYTPLESMGKQKYYTTIITSHANAEFLKSVFQYAGLSPCDFVTKGSALASAYSHVTRPCILLFTDRDGTTLVRQEPLSLPTEFFLPTTDVHLLAGAIEDVVREHYETTHEMIETFLVSGFQSRDMFFLNQLVRETRLQIFTDDVCARVTPKREVPLIPKDESCEYVIALGAILRYNE